VYQIEGKPSLLKLITLAGGLADNHGSTAFIIREIKKPEAGQQRPDTGDEKPETIVSKSEAGGSRPEAVAPAAAASSPSAASTNHPGGAPPAADGEVDDAKYELKLANINSLLMGNFKQNLVIEPGDIINIPPTDIFFVAGEVRSPGSYALREGT